MVDIALKNAGAYAERYGLRLAERLGFGIHGTVHVAEAKVNKDRSAEAHPDTAATKDRIMTPVGSKSLLTKEMIARLNAHVGFGLAAVSECARSAVERIFRLVPTSGNVRFMRDSNMRA